jgi:hypothetical protein
VTKPNGLKNFIFLAIAEFSRVKSSEEIVLGLFLGLTEIINLGLNKYRRVNWLF